MSCECYKIGGPFVAEDPDCFEHGQSGSRSRIDDLETTVSKLTKRLEILEKKTDETIWKLRKRGI